MNTKETLFTVTVDPQGRITLPRALRRIKKIEYGHSVTLQFIKIAEE